MNWKKISGAQKLPSQCFHSESSDTAEETSCSDVQNKSMSYVLKPPWINTHKWGWPSIARGQRAQGKGTLQSPSRNWEKKNNPRIILQIMYEVKFLVNCLHLRFSCLFWQLMNLSYIGRKTWISLRHSTWIDCEWPKKQHYYISLK